VRLAGVLAAAGVSGEREVAVRASGVFVRRLVRARGVAADPEPGSGPGLGLGSGSVPGLWGLSGTVLVTGGTGALGAHVARWAVAQGAERLVLTSRRGLDAPGAVELSQELSAAGVEVVVAACDVADRDAVEALLGEVCAGGRLTAVVHAAGVVDDGVVESLSVERVAGVLRAKADAAWVLHE
ncbi:SDR family NAD(P)-dependent oxidoreductase, partial [Streptomyces sp. G44]|uniref:SDR family NAD(P)-dependent oxidoreductase n=1 Tax=Streptomyces sp. G44 TaxID=2807632 RepID=UPI0019608E39